MQSFGLDKVKLTTIEAKTLPESCFKEIEMKPNTAVQLRTIRTRLGRARAAQNDVRNDESRKLLVSREWLLDALETRVLELETQIVECVGVKDE